MVYWPVFASNIWNLSLICRILLSVQRRLPRTRVEVVRLTWVMLINSFFVIVAGFSTWEEYTGIGLSKTGFENVSYVGLACVLALVFGIVLEAGRIRAAAIVNVGLYAIGTLGVCVSAVKDAHTDPLGWVAASLFASISVANLLLYLGVSPRPFGD